MENRWRWGILLALYLPLVSMPLVRLSDGKELRPSDHGLTNDAEAPEMAQAKSPEMSSFFNGGVSSITQPIPEARNFTDPLWSRSGEGGANHVRKVLIVSSLVCGSIGMVLLVIAGFLFVHRYKNQRNEIVISS